MVWRQSNAGRRWSAVALALALCTFSSAADDQCVVVLRSGGVLHGAVAVQGERYVVTGPNRTIDVQAQQVLLVAPTMAAAFEQQRQQLSSDNSDGHLRLAEWCLRYDLVQQAGQEIAEARRVDPHDPRVPLYERRLSVALKPKPRAAAPPSKVAHDDKSKAELRELEEVAADLPRVAVERFGRKVQPLLVNSCTASGCHESGGKQKFQLDRAVLHGLTNRRITLRNLVATLEHLDRNAPMRSELLAMARRSHGGLEHSAFGSRRDEKLKQVSDWVALVTDSLAEPAPFQPPSIAALTPMESPEPAALSGSPSRFLDPRITAANHESEVPALRPKSKVKFGADLRPWQPKDEFDPEIFNRAQRDRESP